MNKRELRKRWKQLDGCLEALERLEEFGMLEKHENLIDFSTIVNLKNEVEELIIQKTRSSKNG
jgi:hypothetical protein